MAFIKFMKLLIYVSSYDNLTVFSVFSGFFLKDIFTESLDCSCLE